MQIHRGLLTSDLAGEGEAAVGTDEVTEAALAELGRLGRRHRPLAGGREDTHA